MQCAHLQENLRKAEEREHILLGLKKALDKIDRVITVIRGSKDSAIAKVNLMKEFKFSDLQATAILEMKLQKLAGLERKAVENELAEKQKFIKDGNIKYTGEWDLSVRCRAARSLSRGTAGQHDERLRVSSHLMVRR